jgi:hypothetical protein
MTPEQIAEVRKLIASLLAMLGDVGGTDAAPAGMVAVTPTGARSSVKVRYWPAPAPEDFNAFGYGVRVQGLKDADGHQWIMPGQAGRAMMGTPVGTPPGASYAEIYDRLLYPADWFDEVECQRQDDMAARDIAEANQWLARSTAGRKQRDEPAPEVPVDVPIAQE